LPKVEISPSPLTLEQFDVLIGRLRTLAATPPARGDPEGSLQWKAEVSAVSRTLTAFVDFLQKDSQRIALAQLVLDATKTMLGFLQDDLEGTRWRGAFQPDPTLRPEWVVAMSTLTLTSTVKQLESLRAGLPELLEWNTARIESFRKTATWRTKVRTADPSIRRLFYRNLGGGLAALAAAFAVTFLLVTPTLWGWYQNGAISGALLVPLTSVLALVVELIGLAVALSLWARGAGVVSDYHAEGLETARRDLEWRFQQSPFHRGHGPN